MKQMRVLFGLLVLFSLTGCNTLWNIANRSTLEGDVAELLGQHGLTNVELECEMVGRTRTGRCVSSVASDQVDRLVSSLKLQAVNPADDRVDNASISLLEAEGGCSTLVAFRDRAATRVFLEAEGRSNLRLSNGLAFEYLLLYHRPDVDELCVQVSYAYG